MNTLARKMPDDFDWSIFVSKAMLETVVNVMDLTRLERYNSNFYAAIFPAHQYVITRRLLKEHGIKFTAAHRAKIMQTAARMEASR